MIKVQNMFTYGEIGDRLDGVRDSEVYGQSARALENLIITDVGSLKVAKQFGRTNILGEVVKDVKTTPGGNHLLLTNAKIHIMRDSDNVIVYSAGHGMSSSVSMNLVGNDKLVVFDGSNNFKMYNVYAESLSDDTTTFAKFKYPIKKREILQVDLWKVSKNPYYTGDPEKDPPGTNPLRIVQMSAFSDPLLKTSGGTMYLHNSDIKIDRMYTSYNTAVAIEYFTDPAEGHIYGIMRSVPKKEDAPKSEFIIDNTVVQLGSQTSDSKYKGSYFTSISGDGEGVFTFGELIPQMRTASHVNFYQDRLFAYKDGFFYVSKIGEHGDFRNGSGSDNAFFFQLNPIAGRAGTLVDTIADIGLFVLSTAGVYIIGYGGSQLTPTTFGSSIVVASDVGCTNQYAIKDNCLYFLNKEGVLKAVFVDRLSQQIAFNTTTVDKYTNKKLFKDVSKLTIDDRDYIICRSHDLEAIYIIEPIDTTGIFRKSKIMLNTAGLGNIVGANTKIFADGELFYPSNTNFANARISVLPPDMSNPNNGMFLFDNSSNIKQIIVKFLNEDRAGINGIYIDGRPITNLPSTVSDNYSIWKQATARRVQNGFDIHILANQNYADIELQGIEMNIDVFKDK